MSGGKATTRFTHKKAARVPARCAECIDEAHAAAKRATTKRQSACRYVLMATCTGYHPFGRMGERVMVSPEDGERVSIVLPLIPVRVGIIVAVKELVPYNEEFFRSWRERVMSHHEDLGELGALEIDLQHAVVMLKDPETGEKHKFLAIPVQQTDVLDIRHATSSAHPSFCAMLCCLYMSIGMLIGMLTHGCAAYT